MHMLWAFISLDHNFFHVEMDNVKFGMWIE